MSDSYSTTVASVVRFALATRVLFIDEVSVRSRKNPVVRFALATRVLFIDEVSVRSRKNPVVRFALAIRDLYMDEGIAPHPRCKNRRVARSY